MTTATPPQFLKLGKPKPFTGNMNETEAFLSQCELYLSNNSDIYNTPKKMISYVLTLMERGTVAGDWAQTKQKLYMPSGAQEAFPSWADFKTAFLAAFTPAEKQAEARLKMKTIRQKQDETAAEYGARYQMMVNASGVTDEAIKIENYYDGLLPRLKKLCQGWETHPTTLEEYKTKLEKVDYRVRRDDTISNAIRGTSSNSHNSHPVKTETRRISIQERNRRMTQNLCLECGLPGHYAKDCYR